MRDGIEEKSRGKPERRGTKEKHCRTYKLLRASTLSELSVYLHAMSACTVVQIDFSTATAQVGYF